MFLSKRMLTEAYVMPFPYLELHQTNMKTIISVFVRLKNFPKI